jgi:hypothetical protein
MPIAARSRSAALAVLIASLTAASGAQAQLDADQPATPAPKPKPGKKPAKPTKKPAKEETKPAPAEESTPKPAADTDKSAADEGKAAPDEGKPASDEKVEKKAATEEVAKGSESDITNTREDPNVRYYFVGLRYRGTIIPKFIENLFVDEGATVYSNTIGVELDMRKGGQSMMPWITFTDYSMGDTLFHQKGSTFVAPVDAPNYSLVNSSLKAIYLGLDELWSVPIDPQTHHFDFEFGFGVGIGFVFGNLVNNWVYQSPNNDGPLVNANGVHFTPCQQFDSGPTGPLGCKTSDHQNASTPKVGGYVEKNWFNGGSVPVIFPHISFPQLGVRYKPIKQMEARLSLGFSLTGFWFGLSADYGLENTENKSPKASRNQTRLRDML